MPGGGGVKAIVGKIRYAPLEITHFCEAFIAHLHCTACGWKFRRPGHLYPDLKKLDTAELLPTYIIFYLMQYAGFN